MSNLAADQTGPLRVVQGFSPDEDIAPPRRSVAITGGKGGVGKSTVALNLAVALAEQKALTLLVDSDLGMADLNLLLGVAPQRSMLDALAGVSLEEVLVRVHGISLLPALNGSYLLATLGPTGQARILDLIGSLMLRFDSLVIDVAAGIGLSQTTFGSAAYDSIVVVNPEPLSMADAYACIKVLAVERKLEHLYLLPNRVASRFEADELVSRLGELVSRFLDIELTALPSIPADPMVGEAARRGIPLITYQPHCPAARAFRQVERALDIQNRTRSRHHSNWWPGSKLPARGEPR
jgi:flagellar biosynthesis protein FlhG